MGQLLAARTACLVAYCYAFLEQVPGIGAAAQKNLKSGEVKRHYNVQYHICTLSEGLN